MSYVEGPVLFLVTLSKLSFFKARELLFLLNNPFCKTFWSCKSLTAVIYGSLLTNTLKNDGKKNPA